MYSCNYPSYAYDVQPAVLAIYIVGYSIPPVVIIQLELFPPYYRLLTLWFDYGHLQDVHKALMDGVRTIDINTLQLIARVDQLSQQTHS